VTSAALAEWNSTATKELGQIEAAHQAVEDRARGRRYATLQINHAYCVLLSSQFQRYCRNLHSEAVDFLAANMQPAWSANLFRLAMTNGRQLDRGNPTAEKIKEDFERFGMQFWEQVSGVDGRCKKRKAMLKELNDWRNAIAHQDWTKVGGSSNLWLKSVQAWRNACNGLARSFDRAVGDHLGRMVGHPPW
jgi:hypothetical protein